MNAGLDTGGVRCEWIQVGGESMPSEDFDAIFAGVRDARKCMEAGLAWVQSPAATGQGSRHTESMDPPRHGGGRLR